MNDISLLLKYFPGLTEIQKEQFSNLQELYHFWNSQINVISRKDIDLLFERHILHSLGIAKIIQFKPQTKIMDLGTGGGFPGIPLAILFPLCSFHLVDSIGKKIKVVKAISESINLQNLKADQLRAEEVGDKFDFVLSRAVAEFPLFYSWVKNKFNAQNFNALPNGILYLKGGDLKDELKNFKNRVKIFELNTYFEEEFYQTKKVVYLPRVYR